MLLVLPSSKLAEHDLIDGILCTTSSYTLYRSRLVRYTNGGEAGAHWFSRGFTKTEH
jgi:hypothetical protein